MLSILGLLEKLANCKTPSHQELLITDLATILNKKPSVITNALNPLILPDYNALYNSLSSIAPLQQMFALYQKYFTTTAINTYAQLVPYMQLIYREEQQGCPKEHALKLTILFGSVTKALAYLRTTLEQKTSKTVCQICLFMLPPPDTDFIYWRKKSQEHNFANMQNKEFLQLLPLAKELEQLIKIEQKSPKQSKATIDKLHKEYRQLYKNWLQKQRRLCKLTAEQKKEHDLTTQQLSACKVKLAQSYTGYSLRQYSTAMLICQYEKYKTETDPSYNIFVTYGLSIHAYQKFRQLTIKDSIEIPDVSIDGTTINHPGFYLKKLNLTNNTEVALAACLGKLTNCCQFIGGVGEACTIHGLTSEYGGFYVICHGTALEPNSQDSVIAQSWAWRSKHGALVFDSIEKKWNVNKNMCLDFYNQLAIILSTNPYNIKTVRTGLIKFLPRLERFAPLAEEREQFIDYNGYTDARTQAILAHHDFPLEACYRNFSAKIGLSLPSKKVVSNWITQQDTLTLSLPFREWVAKKCRENAEDVFSDFHKNLPKKLQEEYVKIKKANLSLAYIVKKNDNVEPEIIIKQITNGAYIGESELDYFINWKNITNQERPILLQWLIEEKHCTLLAQIANIAIEQGWLKLLNWLAVNTNLNLNNISELGILACHHQDFYCQLLNDKHLTVDTALDIAAASLQWELVAKITNTPITQVKNWATLIPSTTKEFIEIINCYKKSTFIALKDSNDNCLLAALGEKLLLNNYNYSNLNEEQIFYLLEDLIVAGAHLNGRFIETLLSSARGIILAHKLITSSHYTPTTDGFAGNMLLAQAANNRCWSIVKALLECKVQPQLLDSYGQALSVTNKGNSVSLVDFLVAKKEYLTTTSCKLYMLLQQELAYGDSIQKQEAEIKNLLTTNSLPVKYYYFLLKLTIGKHLNFCNWLIDNFADKFSLPTWELLDNNQLLVNNLDIFLKAIIKDGNIKDITIFHYIWVKYYPKLIAICPNILSLPCNKASNLLSYEFSPQAYQTLDGAKLSAALFNLAKRWSYYRQLLTQVPTAIDLSSIIWLTKQNLSNKWQIIKWLVDSNCCKDIDTIWPDNCWHNSYCYFNNCTNLLLTAICNQQWPLVLSLLQKGSNVAQKNSDNKPLACIKKNKDGQFVIYTIDKLLINSNNLAIINYLTVKNMTRAPFLPLASKALTFNYNFGINILSYVSALNKAKL